MRRYPAVPEGYRGVWQRTLLETPTARDDTTWVRWLQTDRWHADLRVPAATRAGLQGFSGCTEVVVQASGEVCHWHRELDLQPPGPFPDAGFMVFESADRVIETGVHGMYREVWERLPDSTGRFIALGRNGTDGVYRSRLLLAGRYLMRVQEASPLGFEISFGPLDDGVWRIERSTMPALEGCSFGFELERTAASFATVRGDAASGDWAVIE